MLSLFVAITISVGPLPTPQVTGPEGMAGKWTSAVVVSGAQRPAMAPDMAIEVSQAGVSSPTAQGTMRRGAPRCLCLTAAAFRCSPVCSCSGFAQATNRQPQPC